MSDAQHTHIAFEVQTPTGVFWKALEADDERTLNAHLDYWKNYDVYRIHVGARADCYEAIDAAIEQHEQERQAALIDELEFTEHILESA